MLVMPAMTSAPRGGVRLLRNYSLAPHSEFSATTELAAYWQSKQAGRIAPSRRDIDPIDIPPHLLPRVFMFDVVNGGADFRYRLIGTGIVDGAGRDSTGAMISRLYKDTPDSLAAMMDILRRAVAEARPLYVSGQMVWLRHGQEILTGFQAVFLPLSADNATIDIILGGLWTNN
jgi:hypothetical protein